MKNILEKIKVYGDENLSNEELLSIALWGEKTNEKKQKIAKNLIKNNKDLTGDLRFLTQISIEELIEQGLVFDEAIRIKAFSGIMRRICHPIKDGKLEFSSSKQVANFFMPELRFEKSEFVKVVILTNKNQALKVITLSKGTANGATITPRDILSEPVKMKATRIILVHNHPSR